jgi:sec-independent protein translocase protein TatB
VSAKHGQVSLSFMGIPPTIEVANLGMADSLILMVMALVVFGPRRLPQIGRQIGKLMYEFRKASNDFKFQMEEELRNSEEADRRKKEEEERQRQLAAAPTAQLEASVTGTTETPAATDSDYPYGGTYGEVAEAQAQAEATYPSIQPPSTGEPVPAAWPANETSEAEKAAVAAEVEGSGAETAAAVAEPAVAPAAIQEETSIEKENAVEAAEVKQTSTETEPAHNG